MCGIFGIIGELKPETLLLGAIDKLRHRGPDSTSIYSNKDMKICLGHTRLSIIDLSDNSNQPFWSDNEKFCIVFNGEIYNYKEIRKELIADGYTFRTQGDTEVLLKSFERWGQGCLHKLNGMFAFCIVECENNRPIKSFLARDRAGEKPLYYTQNSNSFVFASELKALKNITKTKLNPDALNHYLGVGYLPPDMSILDGVEKLKPGHLINLCHVKNKISIEKWWDLPPIDYSQINSFSDALSRIDSLIKDSINLRLRADVPLGILLSGGLDSTLIAFYTSLVTSQDLNTYTIEVPGLKMDESLRAANFAESIGSNHTNLVLDGFNNRNLGELCSYIDEPLADSSLIPSFHIYKIISEECKVAFGGDGGDEIFGGYSDYQKAFKLHQYLQLIPNKVTELLSLLSNYYPLSYRGRNFLNSIKGGAFQQIIWGTPYFDIKMRENAINKDLIKKLSKPISFPEIELLSNFNTGANPLDSMMRCHFKSILPDDFLFKVDRASMFNSIEMRTPFLDHRLIEFAYEKLPSHYKVTKNGSRFLQKALLKNAKKGIDTGYVKQGFSIDLNRWVVENMENFIKPNLEALDGIIEPNFISSLLRYVDKNKYLSSKLYCLAMLGVSKNNLGF